MKNLDRANFARYFANIAALPADTNLGGIAVVGDDGTGKANFVVWDEGCSDWVVVGGGTLDWQASVLSMAVSDPSTLSPSAGDRYIVAAGGVGLWSGKDDDIAEWDGVQWDFTTPDEGTTCEVEDLDQFYTFNAVAWVPLPTFLGVVSGTPPSVDNAIARFDGVTGLVIHDSPYISADNGDLENTGTSGAIKTSDKVDANNSVSTSLKTGDVTGVAATGISGGVDIGSGASVDGDSGDVSISAATPSGTGTQGDLLLDGLNATLSAAGVLNTIDKVTSANIGATEILPGTTEIGTQAETDAGTNDDRYITPLKLATTTVLDSRYYTETELDAAPVAAGAKVDKIVGTDNAIVRSDGIVGAIQDSLPTINDDGNVAIGATLSAWHNIYSVAALGASAVLMGQSSERFRMGSNFYRTANPSWKRIIIGPACLLDIQGGNFTFSSAASDAADSVITFTEVLKITVDGQLQVQNTGITAGLLLGGDVQLYRSAADVLRTPDAFVADGTIAGSNLSGTNTGDEVQATEILLGIAELATQAEVTTGTDDLRIVTPLKLATGFYTKSEVDVLVDATMKAPEAYDPTITGNYPITYDAAGVEKGDSFRITAAGTMGGITVNIEDLLIALIDTPAQVDANWMVAESNRDQATETVKGVAELATQVETDAGTDDLRIVTPLKLATTTILDARYYTETELDANPATGAKIDKFIGTDHAIVRSDGITGAVQDTGIIINDTDDIDTPGQIKLSNASSNTNSKEILLEANAAGTKQTAALQVMFGADPYLRISAPNDSGTKTGVLDIHDTLIALVNDNTVDLGANGSARLKDIWIAGAFNSVGAITSGGTLKNNSGRIKNTIRVTTTYQILVTDDVVFCNTDGGAYTTTLPAGVEGQTLKVINSGSSVAALTVAPSGAEHLIGVNGNFILNDGETLSLTYNATDGWY